MMPIVEQRAIVEESVVVSEHVSEPWNMTETTTFIAEEFHKME